MIRDILNKLDQILLEKSRGLLYRTAGDNFFQGPKDNPTAEIAFDQAEYYPSMPGAYADYNEMAAVGQELFKKYPQINWFNKPTNASKAFAILTFDGPAKGQKTYFGKFFNEIKPDMTGFWKNNELPGGWQLNKTASLKGSYYKLKPSDIFPPESTFDSPSACVAELAKNPKNNPAVPKIMPGMEQLLAGQFPVFEDVGDMASAVRDDLGETIGPIALVQGMKMGVGAEAARKDILGPNGSYAGSKINFPASKINGLVDSYLFHPSGIEIGISSKGEAGATASIKNIADGVNRAREKNLTELLDQYAEQIKVIEEVGKLASKDFPLVLGVRQGLIDQTTADTIRKMIDANAQTINDVPMDATTMGTINKLMSEYKPKPNPRYNAGYHTLAILARHVVTNINKDPKFGEAALKFLNIAPIIQLHLSSSDKGGNLAVTGFTSKYPPDFKGTVGLDASKVYAATGTNGRVTFAYNGGGDTDTDVEPSSAVEPSINKSATDIEAQPTRSNITARGEKKEKPQTDNAALGRKRR
jgi:hypothetical protein